MSETTILTSGQTTRADSAACQSRDQPNPVLLTWPAAPTVTNLAQSARRISPCWPTDPDARVLVLAGISPFLSVGIPGPAGGRNTCRALLELCRDGRGYCRKKDRYGLNN
jgi:hypothetical protein